MSEFMMSTFKVFIPGISLALWTQSSNVASGMTEHKNPQKNTERKVFQEEENELTGTLKNVQLADRDHQTHPNFNPPPCEKNESFQNVTCDQSNGRPGLPESSRRRQRVEEQVNNEKRWMEGGKIRRCGLRTTPPQPPTPMPALLQTWRRINKTWR